MKASEIIRIIENMAPLGIAADWDASGVQLACLRESVKDVAVLLDPTLENLQEAVEAGADFILSHHPLSMQPRFPNRADDYLAVLSLLISRGVWLYSAHTSLDASPGGTAGWLAEELGLQSIEVLEPGVSLGAGAPAAGFGFTGVLPTPLSYRDFRRLLASALGRDQWVACGPEPDAVRRVACCPGSGGGLLPLAAASGADVFITGDVKYHTALDARSARLRVLDVGHFVLEEEMMRRFAERLSPLLTVPVRFFPAQDPLGLEHALV